MKSELVFKLLGYLFSIFFLYLAFKDTDINLIYKNIEYLNFSYILVAFFLTISFYFIRSLYQENNLQYINPGLSSNISLHSIALTHFYNNILPARLGEVIRAFYLSKKSNIGKTQILSYILVEKILDVIFILFVLLIIIMIETNAIEIVNRVKMLPLLFLLLLIFITIFLYFNKHLAERFRTIIPKKYHKKVSKINFDIRQGLNCFKSISQVIKSIVLLLVGWLLVISIYYFISIPYIEIMTLPSYAFIYFLVFTALSLMIPSAPAGIGVVHYGLFFSISLLNPDIISSNIDLVAASVISLHFYIFLIDILSSGLIIIFQRINGNLNEKVESL